MVKVAVLVSGDARFDGRVLKETRTLRQAGHEVSLLDQGHYSPSAWDRAKYLSRAARRMLALRPDVVHANDLDTLPAAIAVKKLTGARVVLDVHEFFGDMLRDTRSESVARFFERIEPRLLLEPDEIIAANEGIANWIWDHFYGRVEVLHNYAYRPNGWTAPPNHRPFTLAYIGTMQPGRMILEAAKVVKSLGGKARLLLWGIKGDWRQQLGLEGDGVIEVSGPVPQDQVIPLMASADAVLGLYDPSRMQNRCGMPNKVYEAMAAGRPSIVADGTAARELVEKIGCGIAIDYDALALTGVLSMLIGAPWIAETMGKTGYLRARESYNWESQEPKLLGVYERLA
jgi:glycosyltransferase involved in cell wall biosynthesis